MKRLLLLLPLMALSSCGGHDLMSNKPFRMTCDTEKDWSFSASISPEMPQATIEANDGKQIDFDLSVISPTKFRLNHLPVDYVAGDAIVIDRQSGKASWGIFLASDQSSVEITDQLECSYESL